MEPSAFLDGCNSAYQRMNTKLGGIKAKSIKQAKTCQGCSHFQKAAKHCNLFRLPIVANSKELFPIINNLTGGLSKSAAKAALVAQHNGETSRVSSAVKTVSSTRTVDKTSTLFGARRREKKATPTLAEVQQMHNAGDKLSTIFQRVASKSNSRHAKDLLKTFVAGLKGTKTKVALTQIDCSLLKNKLATSNGIVGASKCASCTYRSNMSCGLTGGTLLSFPGMEHDSVKRAASSKVKDGSGLVREFDIAKRAGQMDIDIKGPDFADINLTGPSKVDL
jgi:hypothetical protein